MEDNQARRNLTDACHLLYERGYVSGTEGNLSIRLDPRTILSTPSGKCKGRLSPDDMLLTDLHGEPAGAFADNATITAKPSTELRMHLAAYRLRTDIGAIVHAHPATATAFTVAGYSLERCVLPEVVCTLGSIPTAPYATPSTEEVPQSISTLVPEHDAILLDHHGALTLGRDIWDAFYKMELLEQFARIMLSAHLLGGARDLEPAQIRRLVDMRSVYGLSGPYPSRKLT